MKTRLIIAFSICILLGALIPFVAYYRQFYYLFLLGIVAVIILAIKRGRITVYDWLVLFIFTIPFHTFRIGGEIHFIRLSEIAFLPLFLWWLAGRSLNPKGPLKIRKEFFLILGFLVINILSTSKSIYPFISIKRIFIISYLILFCYLISDIIRTGKHLLFIIKAMIVISALSAILAMLQAFVPQFHIFPTHPLVSIGKITLYRAGAGWKDPNYYALYLAMNAALTLSCLLSGQFDKRRFLKFCLFLQLGGIVATFSRMGLICVFFVFLYLLVIYGKRKVAFSLLLISLALVIGLVYSVEYIYEQHPLTRAYVFRTPELEMLREYPRLILVHRWDAFRANWKMFLDNPFLGVGPFMAMYNYSMYKPIDAIWYSREILASHNQYLQLLSEKGIFGFLFFMGFIILIWRNLNSYIKKYKDTQQGVVLIGLKSSIIVYLVASLVAETTHELQFWLTTGLCLALFNILERQEYSVK